MDKEYLPAADAITNALCEKSLSTFVREAWPILEPNNLYMHNWHVDAICFPYETSILTEDGYQQIGTIVNERYDGKVLSYNHFTGKLEWRPILFWFESKCNDLVEINTADTSMQLTHNHPVFVIDKGYIRADKVRVGDVLLISKKYKPSLVDKLISSLFKPTGKVRDYYMSTSKVWSVNHDTCLPDTVYNIAVDTNNNYFAENILVHNCDHLEAVSRGEIRKLIINMIPRALKSIIISVMWPCWTWTWKPYEQWIFGSYAQSLSTRDSMKCRRIIESAWYQARWGHKVQLLPDQNKKDEFGLKSTGHRIAVSTGSAGTGKGAGIVCVPYNQKITTDQGEISMGDIVINRLPVKIRSYNHDTELIEYKDILDYEYTEQKRTILEIETSGGYIFQCTEDHPIYVDGEGYIPAGDLCTSDVLLIDT